MQTDNSKSSPPAGEILDAAVDAGLCTSTNGQSSIQKSLHTPLGDAEGLRDGHAQEIGHGDDDHARRLCVPNPPTITEIGEHPDYRPMHAPDEPLPNPFDREGHQ